MAEPQEWPRHGWMDGWMKPDGEQEQYYTHCETSALGFCISVFEPMARSQIKLRRMSHVALRENLVFLPQSKPEYLQGTHAGNRHGENMQTLPGELAELNP